MSEDFKLYEGGRFIAAGGKHHLHLNGHINFIVGNEPVDAAGFKDFSKFLNKVKEVAGKQHKLINDEYVELRDRGMAAENVKEVRDGLGDIIVTLDGLLYRLDIPYTNIFAPALLPLDFEVLNKQRRATISNLSNRLHFLEMALRTLNERLQDSNYGDHQGYLRTVANTAEVIYAQVYALAYDLGVDIAADQRSIYASNLTKFDTDEAVAQQGLAKYEAMGVAAALFPKEVDGVVYYVIKSTEDREVDGRPFPAGKFLKSVLFQEPVLDDLREGALLSTLFA